MAVVSVHERWEERSGESDIDKSTREYTRQFVVVVDSVYDDPISINSHPLIPRAYEVYATRFHYDLSSRCKHLSCKQTDDWRVWHVTAQYTTNFEAERRDNADGSGSKGEDKKVADENPLNRPCKISFDSDHIKRPLEFDMNGVAVRNTMLKPFDPLPQYDDSIGVLRITKNQASYNVKTQEEYVFSVNKGFFFGIPAEHGKCFKISASQESEKNINYWKVSYEFHFKEKQTILQWQDMGGANGVGKVCFWDYAMLNKGRSYMLGGEEWKLDHRLGVPITENILLDKFSGKITAGGVPLYLVAKKCPRKSWSGLNLP